MKPVSALRVLRISRVVADLDRTAAFYGQALGFETISRRDDTAVMRLGDVVVALVRPVALGLPYPPDGRSDDLWFQHLAIVVADMDAAYAHLCGFGGWQAISEGGPQLLPPENGSVRAFKFRDPDGHPLELIWFPGRARSDALFVGIDHSALAVGSTERSVRFYRDLGFRVGERSLNHGPAQERLDGLPGVRVQVTALRPPSGIGLELLGYQPPGRPNGGTDMNDVVTDWVTIEVATLFGDRHRTVRDPDGHFLVLVDQGSGLPD